MARLTYRFNRIILLVCAVKMVQSVALEPALVSDAGSENSVTNKNNKNSSSTLDEMTKYFAKYTGLKVEPNSGESSIDGHSERLTLPIQETPAFRERILQLQQEFGLTPTGVFEPSLVTKTRKDRCGMTDDPSDPNAPAAYRLVSKWMSKYDIDTKQYHLSYSFQTNTFPSKITSKKTKQGVLSAMCVWELNSNIRFVKNLGENKKADITIGFGKGDHGDRYPFDGAGGTLAHAFYPENGMLHFDEEEPWYLALSDTDVWDKRDIFTVAAHELGHNLGLDHSTATALMAPFYNFVGTFKNFKLPSDDKLGMESMYGKYKPSDPVYEKGDTACKALKSTYSVVSSVGPAKAGGTTTTTVPPRTTKRPATTKKTTTTRNHRINKKTTTTTTTKRTTTTTSPASNTCQDDQYLEQYCENWKKLGYCTRKGQDETMARRCRKTCGLCKPAKKDGLCALPYVGEFLTTFDSRNRLQYYVFNDMEYYYGYTKYDENKDLLYPNTDMTFYSDPKITKREMDSRFPSTHSAPTAVVRTRFWYLVFDEFGYVDQYMSGVSNPIHINKRPITDVFKYYPYKTVDSAVSEYVDRKERVTLFKGDKMWQFEESTQSSMIDFKKGETKLTFLPVDDRTAIDMSEWQGVGACDVDSVFFYRKVPYYLKGNVFWPASSSEKAIGRDIRHHFFRCPGAVTTEVKIPVGCGRSSATSLTVSITQSLVFFLLSAWFART